VPEAPDPEEGLKQAGDRALANLREEFEQRYGPLWSGASFLEIEGVRHELHDVIHRTGFGFEGIKIIDAPAVGAGRYAIRFFDGEVRCIVCVEFGADLTLLEEHRVHIAEWLGDAYFETVWQVNCPMDF
jgi:hypothetical protein